MNYKEKVIALLSNKELSKEQKEKLENIFPELKESEDKNIVHPSTKKQRDLLFSKMKEVGYEWDTTKKELKEIKVKTLDPDKVIEWIRKYRPHIWGNFTLQVDDAIDRFKKDFGL